MNSEYEILDIMTLCMQAIALAAGHTADEGSYQ